MQSDKKLRVALTLVELLVVITIMGLVIAISIPMIKPMLATNKVKNGADMVSGFLAQARNRAIEEGRPVGVTFERVLNYSYKEDESNPNSRDVYPYNGACVLMRQVAEPRPLSGFVKDVRVAVDASGQILFRVWNATTSRWGPDTAERNYWNKLINTGDQIQFNAKGPKYEITKQAVNDFRIYLDTDANRNLAPPIYSVDNPALFQVFRKPHPGKVAPTMAPPVALPEGIVVDLDCSGMGKIYDQFGVAMDDTSMSLVLRDEFCATGPYDNSSVTIMFSSTGEVDKIYYSAKPGTSGIVVPSSPIFLNIGIWERAGFWEENASGKWQISNDHLPEGQSPIIRNYNDLNNYWVTIFPRTGAVRVNRVAQSTVPPMQAAALSNVNNGPRKFANSLHSSETR